jgi:hypothetical protein
VSRPPSTREALRFSPPQKAGGTYPTRIERVPYMAARARPEVAFTRKPAAKRTPDARAGSVTGLVERGSCSVRVRLDTCPNIMALVPLQFRLAEMEFRSSRVPLREPKVCLSSASVGSISSEQQIPRQSCLVRVLKRITALPEPTIEQLTISPILLPDCTRRQLREWLNNNP